MNDQSVMSEGHHMEIKELESILKTEFNEEALDKALLHNDSQTGENILEALMKGDAAQEGGAEDKYPLTE